MDYREVLEQLRGYVQKPVSEEAGKICKTVRALNREQMAVLLTDSEKDIDSLEVQLQNSEYVIALKKELVKSDSISAGKVRRNDTDNCRCKNQAGGKGQSTRGHKENIIQGEDNRYSSLYL